MIGLLLVFTILTWSVAILMHFLKKSSLTTLMRVGKIAAWLISSAFIALVVMAVAATFF